MTRLFFRASLLAIIFFSVCLMYSCRKSVSDFSSEDSFMAEDSVMPDSAENESPKDTFLHFNSASEALRYMENSSHADKYKAGIIPSIASQNLKYATKLLNNKFDKFLVVDKSEMKIFLFDRFGRMINSYKMGCAKRYGTKHKKADSRTPEGSFSVEGIYDSTDWLFTDDNGKTSQIKGQFGPRFIRIKNPVTTQIGIHGTSAPWTIGGRVSHGCIRITNEEIMQLAKIVEPGMPVIINPGPKDVYVNEEEGYDIPVITIIDRPGRKRSVCPYPERKANADSTSVHADSVPAMPVREETETGNSAISSSPAGEV